MYNLDPYGTTTHNGVKVPVILCHADSYKLKLGNNHGDVYLWFNKYGKDMDDVRKDVAALMNASGSVVTPPASTAPSTPTTPNISTFTNYRVKVTSSTLNIRERASTSSKLLGRLKKDSIVTVIGKDGVWERIYEGWIHSNYTEKIVETTVPEFKPELTPEVETPSTPEVVTPSNPSFKSYKVKVTSSSLNIREGASTGRKKVGVLKKGDIVTVIGKNGVWEQISKGWIHSKYTKEVTETTAAESKPTTTTKPESTFTPYKVRIASKTLNVRKGPGSNYEVIDVVKKDEIYTIVGEYSGKGASGWLKLADDKGYIGKGCTRKI